MKKLLKIIGGLVSLIIITAIAVPMFISADYVKTQLQAQVKKATGRELKIEGKASISLLPSIAVKLSDVTFGNPAGFSTPFFVKVKTLSVGAALKPLLNKQLRITDITIDGTTLNLEEATNGAKNWDFVSGRKDGATAKSESEATQKSGPSPLMIDAVHIRDAAVNYRKAGSKPIQLATTKIDADVTMKGEMVKVALNNATLYGGSAKGTAKKDGEAFAMKIDISDVKIEPLMVGLTGASKFEGAATIGLDVTSKTTTLMPSLNGTGAIKMNDGAIKGINIASFLRDVKGGFIIGNTPAEKTDFTEMTASVKISNGVMSNEDLSMKSPVLRLTGAGTVNLPTQTINYRAVPSIVGTLKGQGGKDKLSSGGLDIPLLITGSWSAISVMPDMAGIVNGVLQNPAALSKKIKGLEDAVGDFNSPKDIGKALLGGKKEAAGDSTKPQQLKPEDAIGGLINALGKK